MRVSERFRQLGSQTGSLTAQLRNKDIPSFVLTGGKIVNAILASGTASSLATWSIMPNQRVVVALLSRLSIVEHDVRVNWGDYAANFRRVRGVFPAEP